MASAVVAFKELPAAPTAGSKGLAGLVKELPAAPTAGSKALAGLVKEVSSASAAPYVPGRSVSFSARRLLDTKGALSRRDIDDNDDTTTEEPTGEDTADDRLRALQLSIPKLFSTDTLEFAKPMKLSQLLAALTEDSGAESGTRFSGHGWWVSKEDDNALQLKVAMPGLGKEHVKVTADKNILLIKGEGVKDPEDGKAPAQYNRRIQLPAEAFKMDQIKAEMNDGVLKVTVLKIKDEERKDVFQIKVE